MAYLQGRLQLHDVRDVERYVQGLINLQRSSFPARYTSDHELELVGHLFEHISKAARDYDPRCPGCRAGDEQHLEIDGAAVTIQIDPRTCGKCRGSGRGASFSKYAHQLLRDRTVDWLRKKFGDTRYPNRPDEVSLDELLANEASAAAVDAVLASRERDEPDQTIPEEIGGVKLSWLSPRGRRIFRKVLVPLEIEGLDRDSLAKRLGWDGERLAQALTELRAEFEQLATAA